MQMCPDCNKVYDSAEYNKCPCCSGELEDENKEKYFKRCHNCNGTMY